MMIVKLFIFFTLYAACILAAPFGVPDFSQDSLPLNSQRQPQFFQPQSSDNFQQSQTQQQQQQQQPQSQQLPEQDPTPPLPQPQ